jgi:hypothetical protein
MMRAEDIRAFVKKQPFEPFRITLTGGQTYDIVHPDLAMVGHRSIAVGTPRPNGPEAIYDHVVTISYLHIVQIEPLPSKMPPLNGPQEAGGPSS